MTAAVENPSKLPRPLKQLWVRGQQKKRTIRSITEAAGEAERQLWITDGNQDVA